VTVQTVIVLAAGEGTRRQLPRFFTALQDVRYLDMFFTQLINFIQLNSESLLVQAAKQLKHTLHRLHPRQQLFFRNIVVAQDMQRS
jgi:bifunctional N-acetylglucosamine-1-phosphate-uridyltransferase/glucosamine-1-phosphate-acetyltransferase GlmU-like protein